MSQNVKKALINTSALYGKIIINAGVALITTRIALKYLGDIDFGLFSLIGGVVMMLSFLNGSLMQSTQRFLSLSIGNGGNIVETQRVFNSSITLHVLMSVVLVVLFFAAQSFLFGGFLKIPPDRIDVAVQTYQIVVFTTVVTFMTTPYNAAINAREDMWFFAIADVVMSIMKLGAAITLIFMSDHNGFLLVIYTGLIMLSAVVTLVMKMVWCRKRYAECRIAKRHLWYKDQIKAQLGFTGWSSIVFFSLICRNQGVAIVLNVFFGPLINTAYGVANQVNSLVITFATSLSSVFAPQIIQSYGARDNIRMLRLAIFSSKIVLLLSMLIGLPIIIESDTILGLWLGEVPQYTAIFSNLVVITFIITQFYPGLTRCVYAQGDIKWYQILTSVALVLDVIVGYVLLKLYDFQPQVILYAMITGQIATMFLTVYFAKIKVGLDARKFLVSSVLKPALLFWVGYFLLKNLVNYIQCDLLRLSVVVVASAVLLVVVFYIFIFDSSDQQCFKNLFSKIRERIR